MKRRYAILDDDTLAVFGRGGERRWPVASLHTDTGAAARACAGATLVVESGTLQSVVLDTAAVSSADLRRYCYNAWREHTRDGCGSVQRVAERHVVQRVDGVPSLPAVMSWAARARVGFRRIRHGSQRAEVVYRCLNAPPAVCLIAWESGGVRHVTLVVRGTVLWHRRLPPSIPLGDAMAETLSFAQERRLVSVDARVARVWVGVSVEAGVAEHLVHPAELARTLRVQDADTAGPSSLPLGLPVAVLESACSDLRNPAVRFCARWRSAAQCTALASAIGLGALLAEAWRERVAIESAFTGVAPVLETGAREPESMLGPTSAQRDYWRVIQAWERLPGGDIALIDDAVQGTALGLNAVSPDLQLQRVAWVADAPTQHLSLTLSLPRETVRDRAGLTQRLASVLQRRG
ncbi:MAG: hypothetical protein AAF460_04525 [Pseudomonadota bacterium]